MAQVRGRGEGTIFQRADGRWAAEISNGVRANGKPDRRTLYGKTRREVAEKLKKAQAEQQAGTLADTGGMTVAAFLEKWLEHKARGVRPITLAAYRGLLAKHVTPAIGRVRLDKLRALDLEDLYGVMLDKGLSPRMPRTAHTLMHGALGQAVKWQMLPRNVAEAATPPKARKEEMKVWAPAEAARFLDHAQGHPLHALFFLALMTGMRRGELLGLHWADVDLTRARLKVRLNLVEINGKLSLTEPKTKASRRTIAFLADTVAVLEAHRERQAAERRRGRDGWQDHGLVFPSEVGTPTGPGNLSRAYKRLIKLAGVPDIRFHDLRHTSASLLILKGTSIKVVSDRLGHTNTGFTNDTYVHLFDEQRQEAALGLADLFVKHANVAN